jgi:hypothetical protein
MEHIESTLSLLKITETDSINIDISGIVNIKELYEASLIKKWIKLIPKDKCILFEEYNKKAYFMPIADITLDNEINTSGKKTGLKKRNTLIKLENFDKKLIEEKTEWLYILTINKRIVKIGGTRDGIKNRFGSYLCGHHIPERQKSNKASETNKYIYNTLYFYLVNKCNIKLYGCKLPKEHIIGSALGEEPNFYAQTYHVYESILIGQYKTKCGTIPFLCNNSDPEYKE